MMHLVLRPAVLQGQVIMMYKVLQPAVLPGCVAMMFAVEQPAVVLGCVVMLYLVLQPPVLPGWRTMQLDRVHLCESKRPQLGLSMQGDHMPSNSTT